MKQVCRKRLIQMTLEGIKTHEYCTNNQPDNHSDHVDPYPYLAKWGISREQFKQDIESGLTIETGWKKNDTGYWYVHSDSSYQKDKFEKVKRHLVLLRQLRLHACEPLEEAHRW